MELNNEQMREIYATLRSTRKACVEIICEDMTQVERFELLHSVIGFIDGSLELMDGDAAPDICYISEEHPQQGESYPSLGYGASKSAVAAALANIQGEG